MPRVIGMDVHRDFAQVVALENEGLRQLGRVKLDKDSLTSFANHLASDDEVVLEATGNTFAIVRVLRPKVRKVAVANPLQVRLIAHAKIKTDKVDAAALAQLHASGFLPEIWVPDEETEALRRQFTRRSQLVRHRTRLKNEVHAILNANLIGRCPVTDLFTSTGRKWLAEQVLASSDREAVDRGFREIERIGEDLAALDRALAVEAIDDPRLKRLMTITGIDMVSGLGLIATIGDHHPVRFLRETCELSGLEPKRAAIRQRSCTPWPDYKAGRQPSESSARRGRMGGFAGSRPPAFILHACDVPPGKPGRSCCNCAKAGDDRLACLES
jgi:transposase